MIIETMLFFMRLIMEAKNSLEKIILSTTVEMKMETKTKTLTMLLIMMMSVLLDDNFLAANDVHATGG